MVKLWESYVVGDAQAKVAHGTEARLRDAVTLDERIGLSLIDASWLTQIDIEHVHLAVFGSDVTFFIDDRVGQVVLACLWIVLWETTKREPYLVIQSQLFVSLK